MTNRFDFEVMMCQKFATEPDALYRSQYSVSINSAMKHGKITDCVLKSCWTHCDVTHWFYGLTF